MPKPDFRGNMILKIKDGETQPGWTRAEVWLNDTLITIIEAPTFKKALRLGWGEIPCTEHGLEMALASSVRSMRDITSVDGVIV